MSTTASTEQRVLQAILAAYENGSELPDYAQFRVRFESDRDVIDQLFSSQLLQIVGGGRIGLTLDGVYAVGGKAASDLVDAIQGLVLDLRKLYRTLPGRALSVESAASQVGRSAQELRRLGTLLVGTPCFSPSISDPGTGFVTGFTLAEAILDFQLPSTTDSDSEPNQSAHARPRLTQLRVMGYRALRDFTADFPESLTVIAGANGSGKTSLVGIIHLLNQLPAQQIPPSIDSSLPIGSTLFTAGGAEQLRCELEADLGGKQRLRYQITISGPSSSPHIASEHLSTSNPTSEQYREPFVFFSFKGGRGAIQTQGRGLQRTNWQLPPTESVLRRATNGGVIGQFADFIHSWSFYDGFDVSSGSEMRQAGTSEERPILQPNGGNISAVLLEMILTDRERVDELETLLRSSIPGFRSISTTPKSRGQMMVMWEEDTVGRLPITDLSHGTLRMLAWATLAFSKVPPSLVCVDEPEIGLHPRAIIVLAAALRELAERTQVIVTTHSPLLLSQFRLSEIAVMRKEHGGAVFRRPSSNAQLAEELADMTGDEIMRMHINDELEARS